MSIKKVSQGIPMEPMAAEGLMYHDKTALTDCQKECIRRLGMTIQMEQEDYLSKHPEVIALTKMFIANMVTTNKRDGIIKAAGHFFTRPIEVLDQEIRGHLDLPPNVAYGQANQSYKYDGLFELEQDLLKIIQKYYPPPPWEAPSPVITTPDTLSSSFISIVTSATTLPTPEPVPEPEPTLYESFFAVISNNVDKAFYSQFNEEALRFDTAYVELQKAVEVAMEVPVLEIRVDIAELLYNAYRYFELIIIEKERIAAEIAWSKRMRKKLKRTLRRMDNFRGYETPPTPKSELSSHPSYLKPPPKPCPCHPQFHYNRYEKDRFGIYLPREGDYRVDNITVTPCTFEEDDAIESAPSPIPITATISGADSEA